ncbi:hypothetical protein [Kitasatospora herbaricolor]|uniref:Helix-turn-helix DNA binding domain protein n=1 Tax=Kitasatospora herbaricolor TaxID=68217 RepID=A0ABZ1WLV3_9ACTN|nr:hypothetical protein [Kitasatospora herbaricolor]
MPNQRIRLDQASKFDDQTFRAELAAYIDALVAAEPSLGADYRVILASRLRDAAELLLRDEIAAATREGMTWAKVGEHLGTSAQAAQRRYH